MMIKTFHDFLGRQIKIGDVIFSGGRDSTHGRATLMIVCKFTDKSMVGDALNSNTFHRLKMKKERLTEGKYCIITGMTKDEVLLLMDKSSDNGAEQTGKIDFENGLPYLESYFVQEYMATWPEAHS
jgi:uncharacterized protein (DUF1330 family)